LQLRLLKIESPDEIMAAVTPGGIAGLAAGAGAVDELVADGFEREQAMVMAASAPRSARKGRGKVI
jgi:hypothetical protein